MWLAMTISMIGSGFKSTGATSMFALCGIFGLLLIQVTGAEVPFRTLLRFIVFPMDESYWPALAWMIILLGARAYIPSVKE